MSEAQPKQSLHWLIDLLQDIQAEQEMLDTLLEAQALLVKVGNLKKLHINWCSVRGDSVQILELSARDWDIQLDVHPILREVLEENTPMLLECAIEKQRKQLNIRRMALQPYIPTITGMAP